jgi:hypothetical protein
MCLACEMDALWFAEMEAAARATSGSAGDPPVLPGEIAPLHGGPAPSPRPKSGLPDFGTLGRIEIGNSRFRLRGEVNSADGTPALPTSRFRCEETRSE